MQAPVHKTCCTELSASAQDTTGLAAELAAHIAALCIVSKAGRCCVCCPALTLRCAGGCSLEHADKREVLQALSSRQQQQDATATYTTSNSKVANVGISAVHRPPCAGMLPLCVRPREHD